MDGVLHLPPPPDPQDRPISLVRWRAGGRQSAWHAEAGVDRWLTRCGIKVPADGRVRRRLAYPGNWPEMCGGCKHELVRGAA